MRIIRDSTPPESFFDRQERIDGWDQDRIGAARVLVAGAGALGNETLKNLALLGVKKFVVCDFDTIETSNLSRTVLFSEKDLGKKKVDVAAQRLEELILGAEREIDIFDGDIVWELGIGRISDCDIVLGCLDNVEARRHLGITCKRLGVPFIDAGIAGLSGHVSVYPRSASACYACNITEAQQRSIRRRYSCDDVKIRAFQSAKVPTVQVSSALISALQCQEAIKLLMKEAMEGEAFTISYNGSRMSIETFMLPSEKQCVELNHFTIEYSQEAIGATMTLMQVLDALEKRYGGPTKIDLTGDRYFVKSVRCRGCGDWTLVMKPNYKLEESDLFCGGGGTCARRISSKLRADQSAERLDVWEFGRHTPDMLGMRLLDLGIPPHHVISVILDQDSELYIRVGE